MHPVSSGHFTLMRAFVRSFFVIATNDLVGKKSRWFFVRECWVPVRVHPMPLVHEVSIRAHVGTFVSIDAMLRAFGADEGSYFSEGIFPSSNCSRLLSISIGMSNFKPVMHMTSSTSARSSWIEVTVSSRYSFATFGSLMSAGTKQNSNFLT